MNKVLRTTHYFLLSVLAISCTTLDLVSLESNKDGSSSAIKDKFLIVSEEDKDVKVVVSDVDKTESTLNHVFGEKLKTYFDSQGIETFLIEPSELSLDPSETMKKILTFETAYYLEINKPSQSVKVTKTSGYSKTVGTPGQPGYSTTYIPGSVNTEVTYFYDLKIFDVISNKNVWRSKVTIKGPVKLDTIEELTYDVVKLLVEDEMLDLSIGNLPVFEPKKVLSDGGQILVGILVGIPAAYLSYYLMTY